MKLSEELIKKRHHQDNNVLHRSQSIDLSFSAKSLFPAIEDKHMPIICQYLLKNPNNKILSIEYNYISSRGAKELAANTTLTTLLIRHNFVGTKGAKFFATNTSLTILDLSDNNISEEGAIALAKNTTLTQLKLNQNKIGAEGAKALARNITITELDLTSNSIHADGIKALARNTTLQKLYIGGNYIDLPSITTLAENTDLNLLNLSTTQPFQPMFGSQGAKILATNTTLKTLIIERNDIQDDGVIALAANTTLKKLSLGYNYFGNEGAKALAENTTLKSLCVHENFIQLDGAIALATNNTLTSLSIQNNALGEKSILAFYNALKSNFTLTHLNHRFVTTLSTKIEKILLRNRALPWFNSLMHARMLSQAQRTPGCPLGKLPIELAAIINNYAMGTNHNHFFTQQFAQRPTASDFETVMQLAKLS